MWTSRLIGALFLAGFIIYGTGSILVSSVVGGSDFLAGVSSQKTTLALGAFLMIATTAVDIGKAVFFFPVLERHGKRTAVAYVATMVFEMAMMTVGVLALLMLIPLADRGDQMGASPTPPSRSPLSRSTPTRWRTRSASSRSRSDASSCAHCCFVPALIPRWLAGWGLVGYVLHMSGAAAEILGAPISLVLLIPGGIFEVTLAIWLLVKGFTPAAFEA